MAGHSPGNPWNGLVCNGMLPKKIILEVLKWTRESQAPWDEWVCAYAAEGGHLKELKWAKENAVFLE